MKTIYIIRHCKAFGQEPDASLTPEGEEQAERLATCLKDRGIETIVSSPFARAVATIRPLADQLQLHIHIEEQLSERVLSSEDLSNWMELLERTFSDLDMKLTGGESSREAMSRAVSVIRKLQAHPANSIAVVTHGNLMSLLLKYYDDGIGYEDWKQLSNPDVYELILAQDGTVSSIDHVWKIPAE